MESGPESWCEVRACGSEADLERFREAVHVWIRRPNVVNKRLSHATTIVRQSCPDWPSLRTSLSHFAQEEFIRERLDGNCTDDALILHIRSLVPKCRDACPRRLYYDAVIDDKRRQAFVFVPLKDHSLKWGSAYQIQLGLSSSQILLFVPSAETSSRYVDWIDSPSLKWLSESLMPKLTRWAKKEEAGSGEHIPNKLINQDRYSELYTKLKLKHGKKMAEIWPEVTVTDPQKFVYEDVAIATYLLVLWQDERKQKQLSRKQTFVDLGCGNGLLVHILSQEGHVGTGIDVRRRRIWDVYESVTCLKEMAITPSDAGLFPEADWLIGNHSDELTPWIPLMAARSSYEANYFVLPCCRYDFDRKFNGRCGKGQTQYRAYLDYVRSIGEECGFHVKEDKLRIPSTKNMCQIGMLRSYPREAEKDAEARRTQFLASHCRIKAGSVLSDGCHEDAWAVDFHPRSPTEKLRNCVSLGEDLKEMMVGRVVEELIARSPHEKQSGSGMWRRGGSLKLSEAAALFDREVLMKLKSECGGLQTLLRNQHPVFIVSDGCVELRDWSLLGHKATSKTQRKRKFTRENSRKTKLCWFFMHHPDRCPRSLDDCPFAHGEDELNHPNKI
eukprot:m.45600 g.45600  ORF g.45600 m.45600 type:complete len:613 (+) comp33622_c0_seq14:1105-2943(+)